MVTTGEPTYDSLGNWARAHSRGGQLESIPRTCLAIARGPSGDRTDVLPCRDHWRASMPMLTCGKRSEGLEPADPPRWINKLLIQKKCEFPAIPCSPLALTSSDVHSH